MSEYKFEIAAIQEAFTKELLLVRRKAIESKWTDSQLALIERETFLAFRQKEKAKQAENRLNQKLNSISASNRSRERKLDDKKKILIGAAVLSDSEWSKAVLPLLDSFLKRNADRALFSFELLPVGVAEAVL